LTRGGVPHQSLMALLTAVDPNKIGPSDLTGQSSFCSFEQGLSVPV
jgi:hypothetical protein